MSNEPTIKILISCHKPVCYPKSSLFLPVHVGAEGKTPLPGTQPDNQGDNISTRNFTFCEMTGQYWAWKNLDADYVGQCHYRRFFSFDNQEHEANDHAQIEEECLSPLSIGRYHIADEQAIRSVVASCDMVTAPYWDVKGVPTPCGPKKTIREHMVSYGLVTDEDLDLLISICEEVQPSYKDELLSYLNGSKYLGYNCFIMKRQYFDRLCEFEFSILQRFDSVYDYSHKTTTHKRICGYLGEILYSVFVGRVRKEGASIVERPLVFFDATPAVEGVSEKSEAVHIVWRYMEASPAKLAVSVSGLARVLDANRSYELTIIHNSNFNVAEFNRLVDAAAPNLRITHAVFPTLSVERYVGQVSEDELHILLPFMLPSMLGWNAQAGFSNALWVDGCALFLSDPAQLLDRFGAQTCCARGVVLEKELNKPSNYPLAKLFRAENNGWKVRDASVMVVNLPAMDAFADEVVPSYRRLCSYLGADPAAMLGEGLKDYWVAKEQPGTGRDTFIPPIEVHVVRSLMLAKMGASLLPFADAYQVIGDTEVATWANEETAQEWKSTNPEGMLLFTPETTPFVDPSNQHCSHYWSLARTTRAYEPLIMTLTEYCPEDMKDKLFPVGSRRRNVLVAIKGALRFVLGRG